MGIFTEQKEKKIEMFEDEDDFQDEDFESVDEDNGEYNDTEELTAKEARLAVIRIGLYVTAHTLQSPFHVAHFLWQVQYQPRTDAIEAEDTDGTETDGDEANEAGNSTGPGPMTEMDLQYLPAKRTPSLPRLVGTWAAVRKIWSKEGFLTLWRGNNLSVSLHLLQLFMPSSIESMLNDTLNLNDTTPIELLPHVGPNLGTVVASHIITSIILCPWQLVHTRLVVQKSSLKTRKYHNALHCAWSIVREEGWRALFTGLSMSIAQAIVTSLFKHAPSLILDRYMQMTNDNIVYDVCLLLFSSLGLVALFPLKTIQRRLQAQWTPVWKRGRQARVFDPSVRLSPLRYSNPIDCLVRVTKEEGWTSLYRGFIAESLSNVGVFVLASLAFFTKVSVDDEL